MNKKFIIILLVLIFIRTADLFAQGYIKPTLSLGYTFYSLDERDERDNFNYAVIGFNLDFVTALGLALGFETITMWSNEEYPFHFLASGIGYTHTNINWSAGGKFMVANVTNSARGLGINADATWYFNEYLGLTGIGNFYLMNIGRPTQVNRWNIFSLRLGLSTKF